MSQSLKDHAERSLLAAPLAQSTSTRSLPKLPGPTSDASHSAYCARSFASPGNML